MDIRLSQRKCTVLVAGPSGTNQRRHFSIAICLTMVKAEAMDINADINFELFQEQYGGHNDAQISPFEIDTVKYVQCSAVFKILRCQRPV